MYTLQKFELCNILESRLMPVRENLYRATPVQRESANESFQFSPLMAASYDGGRQGMVSEIWKSFLFGFICIGIDLFWLRFLDRSPEQRCPAKRKVIYSSCIFSSCSTLSASFSNSNCQVGRLGPKGKAWHRGDPSRMQSNTSQSSPHS